MRDDDVWAKQEIIKRSVGAIRRYRGYTQEEAAQAMGISVRTYIRFERGESRFTLKRVLQFSEVMKADPYALFLGVVHGDRHLALASVQNKFMFAIVGAALSLSRKLGEDVAMIRAVSVASATGQLMSDLTAAVEDRDVFSAAWMEEHNRRLQAYLDDDDDGAKIDDDIAPSTRPRSR